MAFIRFTTDVENIQKLDDRPQITATELKACFDQAGVDIKSNINELMNQLEASTSANNLGATALGDGFTSDNVQGILSELKGVTDLLKSAENIIVEAGLGYSTESVARRLYNIKTDLDNLIIGVVPTGSIMEAQLDDALRRKIGLIEEINTAEYGAREISATLTVANWLLNAQSGLYEYDIENEDITEDCYAIGDMDIENQAKMYDGYIASYDGGIKIYTSRLPNESIAMSLKIWKTSDYRDTATDEEVQVEILRCF